MTLESTGTAARLRYYRVRAGKSREDVARHLGINDAWYHDLEREDHALAATLTLFQAIELASFLGVRLRDLAADGRSPSEPVDLLELPARIHEHIARTGLSIERLGEDLGVDLQAFMRSPLKFAAESPLGFLQAMAQRLGIDWLSLAHDERSA